MKRQIAIEIICFLFILLFSYAAIVKLMDIQKFQIQIGKSPLLTQIAGFVSVAIPIAEFITSFMLGFQKTRLFGLLMALTLMVMFTLYIFIIMNFSEHIPCSCGGVLEALDWTGHLIFNIIFVMLGVMGVMLQVNDKKNNPHGIKDILLQ